MPRGSVQPAQPLCRTPLIWFSVPSLSPALNLYCTLSNPLLLLTSSLHYIHQNKVVVYILLYPLSLIFHRSSSTCFVFMPSSLFSLSSLSPHWCQNFWNSHIKSLHIPRFLLHNRQTLLIHHRLCGANHNAQHIVSTQKCWTQLNCSNSSFQLSRGEGDLWRYRFC